MKEMEMDFDRHELKRRREALGLSRSALAREAVLNPSTMSQIESGRLVPYPVQVRKIEEALARLEGEW